MEIPMTRSCWMLLLCLIAVPLVTNAQEKAQQKPLIPLAIGNQWTYVQKAYNEKGAFKEIQPYVVMNSNWGLVDPLDHRVKDKSVKRDMLAERAQADFGAWMGEWAAP
jgi:folate-dependent tRNA-U54 methylase TrmFO/GidA